MSLPAELKPQIWEVVWSHDLDDYIETHLGRPWSLQQNGEHGQDTVQVYEVGPYADFLPEEAQAKKARVEAWLASPQVAFAGRLGQKGTASWMPDNRPLAEVEVYTDDILCELCERGLLPPGNLRVQVWW